MDRDSLVSRVCAFAGRLLAGGTDVLAAVSGGSDSVAMLHLLRQLRGQLGIGRLDIAHVNHGLRPGHCDEDERFVRALAEAGGARFYCMRLSGRTLAEPGVEAWARNQRYGFFLRLCREYGYGAVVTGHTLDDQAETVLLRFSRGCGLVGLAGIHASRPDGVVRPVLCARREELRRYLNDHGLEFRHDSSNADLRFARNRIRCRVLPELELTEPGTVVRLARLAQTVQSLLHRLRPVVNNWIDHYVLRPSTDRIVISRTGLAETVLASEALAEIFRRHGIPPGRVHLEAIRRLGAVGRGEWLLPAGWRAVAEHESVILVRGREPPQQPEQFRYDVAVPGITVCGNRVRFCTEVITVDRALDPRSDDNLSVMLDAREGIGVLEYRNWRPDERFWPLGVRSPMCVRDFLKGQGVPANRRKTIGVVAIPGGEIVWVPGFRVAEDRRVGAQTRCVVKAQCAWLSG